MKMINIKKYFQIDEEKNKFAIPGAWNNIKFQFLKVFFDKFFLSPRLFIESGVFGKYYWSMILEYLSDKYEIKYSMRPFEIRGRDLGFYSTVGLKTEIDSRSISLIGAAPSDDKEVSFSKAVGELLERFSTYIPLDGDTQRLREGKIENIASRVSISQKYHKYTEAQMQKTRFLKIDYQKKYKTIDVQNLVTKEIVQYPMSQIYWGMYGEQDISQNMADITTSGCGGGFTFEMAALSAWYEAIERDSFFCHWLTSSSPVRVNLKKGDCILYDKTIEAFMNCGLELYVLDTTTDMAIPSCIVYVYDTVIGGTYVSGGSAISFEKAIESGLREMRAVIRGIDHPENKVLDLPENYEPFIDSSVRRMERLSIAKNIKYKDEYKFLIQESSRDFNDKDKTKENLNEKQELDYLINHFKAIGNGYDEMYAFISKAKILADLGYQAVRIIVPKLYPLYLSEHLAITDSLRLREFAKYKTGSEDFVINTHPHLFP
jgi:thiazole/oxazole-forming peptide maturase SagD family component